MMYDPLYNESNYLENISERIGPFVSLRFELLGRHLCSCKIHWRNLSAPLMRVIEYY